MEDKRCYKKDDKMRVENSIKNISYSIMSQIVIVLLGFVSRKVFINNLGTEYLGVNGVLTNVISMLGLAESGIGISIIYNLYKPLAEKKEDKVIALIQLYKKIYGLLAIIILILSIIIYPFVNNTIIKENNGVKYITLVYFIFVVKNMISYLNAHKWSLINADQKAYVLVGANLVFQVITTILKIVILIWTGNYILYLLAELGVFLFQNLYNGRIVCKRYPYILTKKKYIVDKDTKDNIINNTKALFLHNIGTYCVFGTDNILISTFVNVTTVGLYSNYTMITGQVSALIYPIMNGISDSVGNLIATESRDKNYSIFKTVYLINFWVYSLAVILMYNLLNPFIEWWLGKEYLLDNFTITIVLINFYLLGLRASIGTFKSKAGIFVQDRYAPLLEAIINLCVSIILVKQIGLVGIFIGTTISTLSIVFWNVPRLVYKNVFKKSVSEYFVKYFIYAFLTLITTILTVLVNNCINMNFTIMSLVAKGIICMVISNLLYLIIFFKTEEFQYLWGILNVKFRTIKDKLIKMT